MWHSSHSYSDVIAIVTAKNTFKHLTLVYDHVGVWVCELTAGWKSDVLIQLMQGGRALGHSNQYTPNDVWVCVEPPKSTGVYIYPVPQGTHTNSCTDHNHTTHWHTATHHTATHTHTCVLKFPSTLKRQTCTYILYGNFTNLRTHMLRPNTFVTRVDVWMGHALNGCCSSCRQHRTWAMDMTHTYTGPR